MFLKILFTIFFCNTLQQQNDSPRVSHLNILLPQIYEQLDYRTIETQIQAFNGCYNFQSSNPQTLSLKAQDYCQNNVVVQVASLQPFQNIIWITAKEQQSGDTIRIESKIQKIQKIEILTKLRTIDVGDVQMLEVQGYDAEGNVFTSLEGVKFQWEIEQENQSSQIVQFKGSNVKVSQNRKNLELKGFQSDHILIKGLETGLIKVNVKLNEKNYQNINTQVQLSIVEHFQVNPDQSIYLAKNSMLQFQLQLIKNINQNIEYQNVTLPNDKFAFKSLSDKIEINQQGKLITKNELGLFQIQVSDQRIKSNQQIIDINVVQPALIEIEVYQQQEIQNFNLIHNNEYWIKALIKDKQNNNIIISNEKFKFLIDSQDFQILEQNNNIIRIKTLVIKDKIKLNVQLLSDAKIQKEQYFNVYSQIYIKPKFIHLPMIKEQLYEIQIFGGSGKYDLISKNNTVFSIQNKFIKPNELGSFELSIKDQRNYKNQISTMVYITNPEKIQFLEQIQEILVNQNLIGYIQALGKVNNELQPYNNCSLIQFEYQDYEDIYEIENNQQGCGGYKLKANEIAGEYKVKAQFQQLQDRLKLYIYDNLQTVVPQQQSVLVALGSQFNWELKNGPQIIQNRQQNSQLIVYENNKQIQQHELTIQKINNKNYNIKCQYKQKQYKLIVIIQNQQDDILQNSILNNQTLYVRCEHPDNAKIEIVDPDYQRSDLVHLKNNDNYEIIGQMFDKNQQRFYAFDSCVIDIKGVSDSQFELKKLNNYKLSVGQIVDKIKLNLESNKYINNQIYDKFQDTLILQIGNQFQINPNSKLLYLNQLQNSQLQINHGSQHYTFLSNNSNIKLQQSLDHLKVSQSNIGNYLINAKDKLQLKSQKQQIKISVQQANQIRIKTKQNLYLQNSDIIIEIQVYDQYGKAFDQDQLQHMDIIGTQGFTLQENTFIMIANKLGEMKVQFQIDGINSNKLNLYVYQKLTSNYDELHLYPGCQTNLQLQGGISEKLMNQYGIQFNYLNLNPKKDEDLKITQIQNNLYEIKALNIINSFQTIEFIYYKDQQILHKLQIKIYIDDISEVTLQQKQVHVKSTFRMVPKYRLKNNNYLTLSICPFEFRWKSQNEILSHDHNSQYALNITAQSLGQTQLDLNLKMPNKSIQSHCMIKVIQPLSIEFNTYIHLGAQNNLNLILPQGVTFKPNVHWAVTITSKSENIQVNDNQIQTFRKGSAVINLQYEQEQNTQHILVTDVDMLFVEDSFKLLQIPIDTTSQHKISLLDQNAQLFPDNLNIHYHLNILNPQIVDVTIQNEFLQIKALKQGTAICEISYNNDVKDIILIKVSPIQTPNKLIVHEGSIIQFNNEQQTYKFESKNPEIIKIDYNSGRGQAINSGQGVILMKDSHDHNVTVIVKKIDDIKTNFNQLTKKEQVFEFQAFAQNQKIESFNQNNGLFDNNLYFNCLSSSDQIQTQGYVEDQRLYCKIINNQNFDQQLQKEFQLRAQVKSLTKDFTFEKSFLITIQQQMIIEEKHLKLNKNLLQKQIKIKSQHDLLIQCDNNQINIIKNEKQQLYIIDINVQNPNQQFYAQCDVFCGITNEKQQIIIEYSSEDINFTFGDYLQFIILFIIVIATILFMNNSKQNTIIQKSHSIGRIGVFNTQSFTNQKNLNLARPRTE